MSCVESGAAAGGVLCGWLHSGVLQEPALCAFITPDLLSAEATPDSSEKLLHSNVQFVLLETSELQTSD